ncbi:PREDICTED: endochitinase-like isoform X2 [Tarenaya hassleriana]|uniref:endochitinase-like isoform X2 n=1 Tax=Tarenaya hassleriana TaxID=28532 RepID=UPI00053C97F3|nr:PREDICTED: endochitinase-like isoform X2 [Tarenaya hassleriana]
MKPLAVILVALSSSVMVWSGSAENCGWQYGGALCRNGQCCSQWGWCGTSDDYCGNGCQSQCHGPLPPSPAKQCGWQNGGALCPDGQCCSQWGWCGASDDYCGKGCQSQCDVEQCGWQNGGTLCPNGKCCSQWGWCGISNAHCGEGCQSQCHIASPRSPPPVSKLISRSLFEQMLPHRNNPACSARGFYTYDAFLKAASSFPGFGTTGDEATRKREIVAFFGQTSHETNGEEPTAPDEPYAWGYCIKEEVEPWSDYCEPGSSRWQCVPGKRYFGRGPFQLSWNHNYGPCGEALGLDLLGNPDHVANDSVISFKTALWFWMTPQAQKPSCHEVITSKWVPSKNDVRAGRLAGYGAITNIINGGLECGIHEDARARSRIGFYKRYCDILGVTPGDNLDCDNQLPFGFGPSLDATV